MVLSASSEVVRLGASKDIICQKKNGHFPAVFETKLRIPPVRAFAIVLGMHVHKSLGD